ncbi:methylated DNA-protein cysteine methyltransferase [Cenarchaeum symbiosum A]|uniref:Methylated DNA-protein cysteine methyltransferase n=1 Tax=Cenarchaeum symbiosum (strain A) TaxID=414004 RepID=A0RUF9_CENSY|nr:methylated DNA-protein cysteine methyltransferase [Cenarchaeum symbiosum A]
MKLDERVYKELCRVPRGKVTTYGALARAVGLPNGQRIIGRIMKNNPYPGIVPCHRVVRSDGKVGGYSPGGMSGGEMIKSAMLEKEGIGISGGKIRDLDGSLFEF